MVHTHDVTIDGDVVRKRFVKVERDEPAREWETLVLLAEHAPGLAPRPISFEDGIVTMSRVPGEPLDAALTRAQTVAMTEAYRRLFDVPLPDEVPDRLNSPEWFLGNNVEWLAAEGAGRADLPDVVREALDAAIKWHADAPTGITEIQDPVLVQGDGNVDNMLWDGEKVRLIDFEDGGRGDLAFEIADLVEHASSRLRGLLDPDTVLDALTPPHLTERVAAYRIVLATFWLLMLLPGNPAAGRNPPGSLEQQAAHLLTLV